MGNEIIDFKTQLRAEIARSGLSQRVFAEKLGVPQRTLESWVLGVRLPNPFTQKSVLAAAEGITK